MTPILRRLRRLRHSTRRWQFVAVAIVTVIISGTVGAILTGAGRPEPPPAVVAATSVPIPGTKAELWTATSHDSALRAQLPAIIGPQGVVPRAYPHVVESSGQEHRLRYIAAFPLVLAVAAGLLTKKFGVLTLRFACILLVVFTTTASLAEGHSGARLAEYLANAQYDIDEVRRPRRSLRARPQRDHLRDSLPGSPTNEWDVSGAGDPTLQGYATQMSVNVGEPVRFKIKSTAAPYRIDIYRLGYYQGDGARRISSVAP